MKPTPRAKFGYNARSYSSVNKETVSISSLVNADITLKVLYEAHGQGLEKDEKDILASTLKTTSRITTRLEKLLTKHHKVAGSPGIPLVGAEMQRESSKCASCSKKLSLLTRGGNCACCGFISCTKCISHRHVPRSFGYDDTSHVKVCILCCNWFKEFLNTKFDEHSRPREHEVSDSLSRDEFLSEVDAAAEAGYLPLSLKSEFDGVFQNPLTLSIASSLMSKLKQELISIITHYEYQDDLDSNDSDNEQPTSIRKISKVSIDKKTGVPCDALRCMVSLMESLDKIQPREDEPLTMDSNTIDSESLPDPPVHTRLESEEFEHSVESSVSSSQVGQLEPNSITSPVLPSRSFMVTLFRRATDRYLLIVKPQVGVVEVVSIVRGTVFTFLLAQAQFQSVVGDAVRISFTYRADLVYQFASDAEKSHFFKAIESYRISHPIPEKPRLPLVPMLKGERKMHASSFGGVALLSDSFVRGAIMATNYRVLFVPIEHEGDSTIIDLPLFAIINVSRMANNAFNRDSAFGSNGKSNNVIIQCKDVRAPFRIEIQEDKVDLLVSTVNQLAESTQRNIPVHLMSTNPNDFNLDVPHFAFSYTVTHIPIDGWQFSIVTRDYERLGLVNSGSFQWVDNENGDICDSYPGTLVLPSNVSRINIATAACFRAKNRLPVVTWIHPQHKSILARSSQPLLGRILSGASCTMDESIIECYRTLPGPSKPFYIFDARKSKAAAGNRLMGKGGVETSENYEGAIIYHLDISNMYKMQASFQALVKVCTSSENDKSWWSAIEGTRWFEHLHLILDGAARIARVLDIEGASALVHCSDGWDRTCQLVCLAQLILDPFYRTLHGFASLVEKDWCLFGHKFMERLGGNRSKDPTRSKMSPIFLQFLDAVYQIMTQFPTAFEFNENCLLHIANALSSGMFGTFVYDSYQQRKNTNVYTKTVSVWTPLCASSSMFLNPNYIRETKMLSIWTSHHALKLWTGYFLQHHEQQRRPQATRMETNLFQQDIENI